MTDPTLRITISLSAKQTLTRQWGSEVILRCSCGDLPSHTMYYQYGPGKCPKCRQVCEMIEYEWGIVDGS
jgi:hypothetical protein